MDGSSLRSTCFGCLNLLAPNLGRPRAARWSLIQPPACSCQSTTMSCRVIFRTGRVRWCYGFFVRHESGICPGTATSVTIKIVEGRPLLLKNAYCMYSILEYIRATPTARIPFAADGPPPHRGPEDIFGIMSLSGNTLAHCQAKKTPTPTRRVEPPPQATQYHFRHGRTACSQPGVHTEHTA